MRTVIKIKPYVDQREKAIELLLPKCLGILWEHGIPGDDDPCNWIPDDPNEIPLSLGGDAVARLDKTLGIGICRGQIDGLFIFHIYGATAGEPWTKLLSTHLADRSIVVDPRFKYWGGRCCILSWKRGEWEDRIIRHAAASRTFAHLMTAGLLRRGVERPGAG